MLQPPAMQGEVYKKIQPNMALMMKILDMLSLRMYQIRYIFLNFPLPSPIAGGLYKKILVYHGITNEILRVVVS